MKTRNNVLRQKPKYSSMVNSEKELEKHSKIMEQMDTNKIPDPKQFSDQERSK
jgi:hypothetical protein